MPVVARALIPTATTTALGCLIFAGAITAGVKNLKSPPKGDLYFVLIWLTAPVAIFVLLSLALGTSFVVDRYWLWQAPSSGLLAVLIWRSFNSEKARVWCAFVLGLILLSHEMDRKWETENWREAAMLVNKGDNVVSLYSGLAELDDPKILQDETYFEYLSAPFQVYRVDHKRLKLIRAEEVINPNPSNDHGYIVAAKTPAWRLPQENSFIHLQDGPVSVFEFNKVTK